MLNSAEILGVKVTTASEQKILEYIAEELKKPKSQRSKRVIFTPNPEQISAANRDPSLKTLLNSADVSLPDGVGVIWGAKLLGKPIFSRITGVDFMKSLVKMVSEEPFGDANRIVRTGYYGGQEGVAVEAADCLQKMVRQEERKAKNLHISYASHAYDKHEMEKSNVDILFVGLGFPKQEKWIMEHKDEIPATIIMAVGGSLDFLSGQTPRAQKFVRDLGLEWLFRLMIQPWRFFRQAQLLHFGALILIEALSNRFKILKT